MTDPNAYIEVRQRVLDELKDLRVAYANVHFENGRLRELIESMASELSFAADCRQPDMRKWRALVEQARLMGVWPPK